MSTTPAPDSPAPTSASSDAAHSATALTGPAPEPVTPAPAALDAHGHDPDAYKWVPVLKKRRVDGWSPEKQRAIIDGAARHRVGADRGAGGPYAARRGALKDTKDTEKVKMAVSFVSLGLRPRGRGARR